MLIAFGSHIDAELRSAAKLVGFDKVLFPLLKGLVKQYVPSISRRVDINNSNSIESNEVQSLMLAVLTYQDTPTSALQQITELVLEYALSSDSPQIEMRPVLSALHQRHPAILNSVSQKIIQNDNSAQSSLRELLVSLSLVSYCFYNMLNHPTLFLS